MKSTPRASPPASLSPASAQTVLLLPSAVVAGSQSHPIGGSPKVNNARAASPNVNRKGPSTPGKSLRGRLSPATSFMNAKSFRITNGVDAIKKRMAEHGTKFGATALQLSFQNSNTSVDLFTSKELTKLSAKFEDPHLEDTYQAHLLAGGRRERSFQFFGAITALVLLLDVCIGLPKMLHQTVDGVTEELAARDDLLLSLLTCRAAVFIPSFAARLLPVASLSA